jgi:CRP-like cAMP-binding protein
MEVENYSGFKKISLQFVNTDEFKQIEKTSVYLRFNKGETILKQGHQPTHIAFLQSGIVKFNFASENGKNTILTLVSAPKILGGANLFYKDNNLFSIVAVEDCEVFLIESNVLFELLKKNGRFAVALFQLASDMFKRSIVNFISVANKQKEGRIADVFLYLLDEVYFKPTFNLSLTRKELAEYACCSVENVIMTLSKWQQEGIIHVSGKKVEIINLDKLKQISKIG